MCVTCVASGAQQQHRAVGKGSSDDHCAVPMAVSYSTLARLRAANVWSMCHRWMCAWRGVRRPCTVGRITSRRRRHRSAPATRHSQTSRHTSPYPSCHSGYASLANIPPYIPISFLLNWACFCLRESSDSRISRDFGSSRTASTRSARARESSPRSICA